MNEEKYVDYTKIGKRIANRRRKMGLKQSEVNELINYNDKYLSHVESGKMIPSIDAIMKICSVLNTTPDFILLGCIRNDGDDEFIREKIKMVKGRNKIDLVSEFIDWIAERDL